VNQGVGGWRGVMSFCLLLLLLLLLLVQLC
jgi:hypothetical protein